MKRVLFLIPIFFYCAGVYAQTSGDKDHPIYHFDNAGTAKDIYKLGTDPEFPFLRNLSSPQKVVAAMKSAKSHPKQYKELNTLLIEAGFDNGVQDVTASSVFSIDIAPGTVGNMGDGHFNTIYSRMAGGKMYKAWKVTSPHGGYICFLSPCGNAFYPQADGVSPTAGTQTGCKEVAVNLGEPEETTVTDTVQQVVRKETYVYYTWPYPGRYYRRGGDTSEGYRSEPLLIDAKEVTESVPVVYKVTNNGSGVATVCDNKLQSVSTDFNVEREGEYTGYRQPEVKREYIEVSKWDYDKAALGGNCSCK